MTDDPKLHFYVGDVEPGLRELQGIVGGHIEIIHLNNGEQMICNEDGMALDLPQNPKALAYAWNAGTRANISHGIRGNVAILRGKARLT